MGDIFDLSKNIPDFLNIEYFQKILGDEKDLKILDISIGTASKPGDNFVGAVYRVKLTTNVDSRQFIVKVPSSSAHETLHSYLSTNFVGDLFKCEIEMYGEVLPKIMKLWSEAGYKEEWCPRLIYQTADPQPIIILEDVSPLGFATLEKPTEDFEASKMVARRLAKFHAASYYLTNEKLENFSHFTGILYDNKVLSGIVYNMGLAGFIHVANQKSSLSKYTGKLQTLLDEFEARVVEDYKPSATGINVLCHNDFHLKNLLFRRNQDGKIDDIYAIDFQLCNFTSPAFDLIYMLFYFVSAENRRHHRDEIISIYYNQFCACLNDFKFSHKIPSRKMLDDEIRKCSAHEILTAICLAIFYYFDLTTLTAEDLDFGEGTMKAKYRMYENKEFLEMIEWQLADFEERGIL